MRYFSVAIAVRPARRLSLKVLFDVAAIGATTGTPRGRRLETTMTVRAKALPDAAECGILRVLRRCPGEVLAVEAMTIAEADRRLAAIGVKKRSSQVLAR